MTTTQNEYTAQAIKFLEKHNIKFRISLKDSKPCSWKGDDGKCGHHYRVTLSKPKRPALVFDFWGSIADSEQLAKATEELKDYRWRQHLKRVSWADGTGNQLPDLEQDQAKIISELESQIKDSHPSAYDVLACISSDIHCPTTHKEFCSEMGYEEDSIKGLQTFRRCLAFSKRLNIFFTAKEMEDLGEIV